MATPNRNFRIADADYDPAFAKAQRLGEPLTEVVIRALRDYAAAPDPVVTMAIGRDGGKFHRKGSRELDGTIKMTACGAWTRDMVTEVPLDQVDESWRCRKCWRD